MRQLPKSTDTRGLARLLREIRGAGDPDQRAQDAAADGEGRQAKLADAVSRVRSWRQDAEELIALPVLPAETYVRLHAACSRRRRRRRPAIGTSANAPRRHRAESQRLAVIVRDQPDPGPTSDRSARRHRDAGWQLIYRRAFTAAPPDAAQETAGHGELPLPLAFEHSVAAADELADRRNREGERLAQATELARRIERHKAWLAAAETKRATAAAQRECRAGKNGSEACVALALPGDASVAELRAFLVGRERVVDADEASSPPNRVNKPH